MDDVAVLACALTWCAGILAAVPLQDRWERTHPGDSVRRRWTLVLLPVVVAAIPAIGVYFGVISVFR